MTALVVALAGLGGAAPATSAPPFDETGLMTAGGYAEFDVLANDGDAAEDWYAEPVDTSDPTVSGGFGPSLFVYLYDTPGFTGQRNIPYNVYDGFGDLKRTSTLTLHVTSDVLIAEGGNAQVTLKWPDLPAAVTGARISYSADGLFDHESPGVTTVTRTGPAPWTIDRLVNGTDYEFYVTPQIGASEMQEGLRASRRPRAVVNSAPTAVDDTVSLIGDDEQFFYPTGNDSDPNDDDLQLVSHSSPAHGVLSCDDYGCGYDPTGTRQNDSFTYTVSDGYGGSDTATVSLVSRNVTLADDSASTPATKDKVVNVLANDTGVLAGDRVDVNAVSGGAQADVLPDRTVLFRAPAAGTYTFTYEVLTGEFDSLGTATATITVTAAPPISANPDADETVMGVPVTISVGRNDVVNPANFPLDNLDTRVVTAPGHGTAVVDFEPERYGTPQRLRNLPVITYTPTRHWKGTDTFTYQVKDSAGNTDTATVAVTVGTPAPDYAYTDDGLGETDVFWDNPSPDVDQIEVCYATSSDLTATPAYPTRPCANRWPVTGAPDTLHVTGLTNGNVYAGSLFFHYDDGTPAGIWTDAANFEAYPGVRPVDTLWSEAGTTTPDASPGTIRVFWRNPSGSTGTTVTWSTSAHPQTVAAAGANKIDAPAGATQVDIPGLTEGTTYYVTVFARNPGGGYAHGEELSPVLLRATNAAPAAVTDAVNVNRNQPMSITPRNNDTDPDAGDAKGIRGHTNPAHGTVTCSLFSCGYTPATNFVGTDSFQYTLSDGHWGTSTGTVNLTVGAPRNPVGGTGFYTATINKKLSFDLDDTAFDADGGPLTYSGVSALPGLVCQADGACTYTGAALGNVQLTFTVTDDTARTGTGTVRIEVVANQLPRVPTQFKTVLTGTSTPITLAATDPDGDVLVYGDISKPQKGALTCTTQTVCTYNQNLANKSGEDSFFYSVDDQHGGVVWGEVYITIQKVNHAPVARNFLAPSTNNATVRAIDLEPLVTDSDGDELEFSVVAAPAAAQGTVTCSEGGSCSFTPKDTFTGTATFTYRAHDGRVFSNTATVSIPVTQANRPPAAQDKTFTVRQGDAQAITLSQGVSDPDLDPLTYGAPTDPPHGTVTCTTSTACSYTSEAAYVGPDSFTYPVSDGQGHTKTITVALTVVANQAPVTDDETATTPTGVPVDVDVRTGDSDPEGKSLTFAKKADPVNGSVSCTVAGVCTYTSTAGFVGTDTFTYEVSDDRDAKATGTVTVTVTPPAGTATIVRSGAATRSVKSPLKVAGTMSPAVAGATVTLQRATATGSTWTNLATAVESATGTYSFSRIEPTGSWKYRVTSAANEDRGATTSAGTIAAGFYAVSMPSHKASGDKYVTIKNTGKISVNLKGWTITTKAKRKLTLPSKSLAPGKSVRIHPGTGRTTSADIYLRKGSSLFARHESLTLRDLAKVTVATRRW